VVSGWGIGRGRGAVFGAVLGGGAVFVAAEGAVEIWNASEADLVGDLGDGGVGVGEEGFGVFEADVVEVLGEGLAGDFVEASAEVAA